MTRIALDDVGAPYLTIGRILKAARQLPPAGGTAVAVSHESAGTPVPRAAPRSIFVFATKGTLYLMEVTALPINPGTTFGDLLRLVFEDHIDSKKKRQLGRSKEARLLMSVLGPGVTNPLRRARVCVCVCACVSACACVHVCAYVCVHVCKCV